MTAICLLVCALGADVYSDFFERGNAAYAAGSMADAVSAYEELAASGVMNPEVCFNLGNAYYHQGDLGRAVLNYERALGLRPDYAPAQRNLAVAVAATKHQYERPRKFSLDTWRDSRVPGLPQPVLLGVLLVLWWSLWGILAARQARGAVHRKWAGAPWILLVLCAAVMADRPPQVRSAVVTAPEAPLRYGPDERDAVSGTLAAGDRITVDLNSGGWARIETASGVRGWLGEGSVTYIGPPFARASTEREQPPQ